LVVVIIFLYVENVIIIVLKTNLKLFKLSICYYFYMDNTQIIKKKRGRKAKIKPEETNIDSSNNKIITDTIKDLNTLDNSEVQTEPQPKVVKKRGRKPKGGKIIVNDLLSKEQYIPEQNIILHLKCNSNDLNKEKLLSSNNYDPNIPNIESYQFETNKLNYHFFYDNNTNTKKIDNSENNNNIESHLLLTNNVLTDNKTNNINKHNEEIQRNKSNSNCNCINNKIISNKIKELSINLHTNNITEKKSACFWCSYDFDSLPIYIPKYELNNTYYCYGCFCSPECAVAYLFKEPIDTTMRFERYHLINHLYCKIYDYKKNIKPAPDPYYTLNKFYGNLSIQEYRKLLKNERLLLIVDKPLTRILPELHEENDDFVLNNKSIPSATNVYKLRRKTTQSKNLILNENFNLNS